MHVPRSFTYYLLHTGNWPVIMELQWLEFLIMRTFQLHASTLMFLRGEIYNVALGPLLWIRSQNNRLQTFAY